MTDATTAGWRIELLNPRSDSRTDETHQATADKLGMERRDTIELTLAAYVRGEGGRAPVSPVRQGARIDPILAAIAAMHGIKPLRLLRARHLGLGFSVTLQHEDAWNDVTHFHDEYMPEIGGVAHLAPGITYAASRVDAPCVTLIYAIMGDMPNALRASFAGRPLSSLVRIPGLERDPMILSCSDAGVADHLTIERMESILCTE